MKKNLIRYPQSLQRDNLYAHSSADELLLEHLEQQNLALSTKILIINDQFGALSYHLSSYNIEAYTDSYMSYRSIEINTDQSTKQFFDLSDISKNSEKYDLVLCYLPKNHSFLEDILAILSQSLKPHTPFIFTGMVKHMSRGHFQLIEKYIGPLTTSLAKKKARLIFSRLELPPQESPFPKYLQVHGLDHEFTQFSNIFSRDKLDIGTRFFLDHLPVDLTGEALDLACGNGILGIKFKLQNPSALVSFTDESFMAMISAKTNYRKYSFNDRGNFFWSHSAEAVKDKQFDFIMCNPPFHQGTTVSTHIAHDMFKQSYKVLKKGGSLRIVANSHLGYPSILRRNFKKVSILASNKKFLILEAIK